MSDYLRDWDDIADSLSQAHTSVRPLPDIVGKGGRRTFVQKTVAHSPGLWSNVDRLRVSPPKTAEITQGLIVDGNTSTLLMPGHRGWKAPKKKNG